MRRILQLLTLVALATACLPVAGAAAESFPVTSAASGGAGSLRASIEAANANPGSDRVPIEVRGLIELQTPLPTITEEIHIVGPGADLLTVRRSAAAPAFRILDFAPGMGFAALSGLTIRNGRAAIGAGINSGAYHLSMADVTITGNEAVATGGEQAVARGGGIASVGYLSLRQTEVSGNVARASAGSTRSVAEGGGISAEIPLGAKLSTISGNTARAEATGGEAVARGGGVYAPGWGTTIDQSTISGNTASASGGETLNVARGGGVLGGLGIQFFSATVAGNSVASPGLATGANLDLPETPSLFSTIVADPVGAASCSFPIGSGGFNLDEDSSCGVRRSTDLTGVDPLLAPLAENGGPTPTRALLPGSPALDRGNGFGFSGGGDQRGLPRLVDLPTVPNAPEGNGADIGAYELQALPPGKPPPPPAPPASVVVSLVPGDRQAPDTRVLSGPARVTFKRFAEFRFAATEGQSSFQCKVDKRRWRRCASPYEAKVSAGKGGGAKHVFQVRAIDRFGNVDPTPARFGWRVKRIEG